MGAKPVPSEPSPAPWWFEAEEGCYAIMQGREGDEGEIGRCYDSANAHLMVASPDLLAELSDNIARWYSSGVTVKDVERVQVLIAKARGR